MLPSEHQLHLINWLASREPDQLEYLIRRRGLSASQCESLSGLARALGDEPGVTRALQGLERSALLAVKELASGKKAESKPELARLGLVDDEHDPPRLLMDASVFHHLDVSAIDPPTITPRPLADDPASAALAGAQVETILCFLDDLISLCTTNLVSLTKDGNPTANAMALIHERIGDSIEPSDLIRFATTADLVAVQATRLRPGGHAAIWQAKPRIEQWRHVATAWWAAAPAWLTTTIALHPLANWGEDVPALVSYHFPLVDASAELAALRGDAAVLGLTLQGSPSLFGLSLWSTEEEGLESAMPEYAAGVYAMDDFTLLAPGPISPAHRRTLDDIAEKELGGLVPRYRITADSIQRALAQGHQAETLTERLAQVCLTPLPDGVVRLIEDTIHHSRRIVLRTEGTGTRIELVDSLLAQEIDADQALQILPRTRVSETAFDSPWPIERVRSVLESARYATSAPAVVPTSPGTTRESAEPGHDEVSRAVEALVQGIQADRAKGVPPGIGGILDVAIANKIALEIECLGPDGTPTRFQLEPKALSNGRLRGIEIRHQMERTIPVSRITQIAPAQGG